MVSGETQVVRSGIAKTTDGSHIFYSSRDSLATSHGGWLLPAETEGQLPNYEFQFELLNIQVFSRSSAIEWQIGIWV